MIYLITTHVLLQVRTTPRKSPEAAKVDPSRESRSAHKKKHSPEAFKSVKRSKSSLDEDKSSRGTRRGTSLRRKRRTRRGTSLRRKRRTKRKERRTIASQRKRYDLWFHVLADHIFKSLRFC